MLTILGKAKFNILLGLLVSGFVVSSCGKPEGSEASEADEQSDEEITIDNDEIPISSPNSLAVGGLPKEEDIDGAFEMTGGEVSASATDVHTATIQLPLGLAVSPDELSLTQEDDGGNCQGGLFCLAHTFSKIFDMVTGAAECNFKLLLGQYDAGEVPFKKVEDRPIYYIDGFGAIGIGDQGQSECPSLEDVDNWAKKHRFREGTARAYVPDNTFFPPSRLVMFRHRDGNVRWKIVFFPKDFIQKIAVRVPRFKGFLDQDLDFSAYHGSQEFGNEVGEGVGSANIDWNELARMMDLFQGDGGQGGTPQGKISIDYNMQAEHQSYQTTFLDDFSFGDDDDSPFKAGTPTKVFRAGGENYIHFQTNETFGRPDPNNPDDDGGPMGIVQFCLDDSWKSDDGDGPFGADIKYVDVPKESYLAEPSKSHMQMIWLDQEAKGEPDNYSVSMTSTKGGAYIYGDVQFMAGAIPSAEKTVIRTKAPLCSTVTAAQIAELEKAVRTVGNQPGFTFVDEQGFRNMLFDGPLGPNTKDPSHISQLEAEKLFPSFTTFHLIDVGSGDKPYTE